MMNVIAVNISTIVSQDTVTYPYIYILIKSIYFNIILIQLVSYYIIFYLYIIFLTYFFFFFSFFYFIFFFFFFFFFQAEDGIRDLTVTGVQTCALPIIGSNPWVGSEFGGSRRARVSGSR